MQTFLIGMLVGSVAGFISSCYILGILYKNAYIRFGEELERQFAKKLEIIEARYRDRNCNETKDKTKDKGEK